MKTNRLITLILLTLALSTTLWSCKDDEPAPPQLPTVVERPSWSIDFTSNDSRPAWEAEQPPQGKYQFSMTAAVTLSDYLSQFADEDDLLAAFVGDECRGAVKPIEYEGRYLFLLHFRGNSSESDKVSLRYYSAANKRIYECKELFGFEPNATFGSIAQPQTPPFDSTAKYPETMDVVLRVTEHPTFSYQTLDMLAVFIGDECRGVAVPKITDGEATYTIEIRGGKNESGTVRFRYFSSQVSGMYESLEQLSFFDGRAVGSANEPFMLTLQPIL
jgi:hypothetical protein